MANYTHLLLAIDLTEDAKRVGERAEAVAAAATLWLAPRSQPKACDPLFEALIDGGHITPSLAWDRFMLALEAQRPALARYLLRSHVADADAAAAEKAQ